MILFFFFGGGILRLFVIELRIGAGALGLLQWKVLKKLKKLFGCSMDQ
jgi:hypothetical protein